MLQRKGTLTPALPQLYKSMDRQPTRIEGLQVQALIVQDSLRLFIGREKYLEASVQQESIHLVCPHAPAHRI